MRSRVKICGEQFDIDQVEGGKIRASSIKLPGFELVAATHNLLRMRMQKALAEYDRAQLLKPAEDVSQKSPFVQFVNRLQPTPYPPAPQAPGSQFATGSGKVVWVSNMGALLPINCRLTQLDGEPKAVSEFGLAYNILRYRSDDASKLVAQLKSVLDCADNLGATDIVWRRKPAISLDNVAPCWLIDMRLHFLPQFVNAQISWHSYGQLAPVI